MGLSGVQRILSYYQHSENTSFVISFLRENGVLICCLSWRFLSFFWKRVCAGQTQDVCQDVYLKDYSFSSSPFQLSCSQMSCHYLRWILKQVQFWKIHCIYSIYLILGLLDYVASWLGHSVPFRGSKIYIHVFLLKAKCLDRFQKCVIWGFL